jgi:hypothetical protein
MMRVYCFGLVFLWSLATAAEVVVPAGGFAPGWKESAPVQTFTENDLYGYIDGGAELFLELGFQELLVQRYARAGDELVLEVYQMTSTEAALAIYLLKCGREKPVAGIAVRNTGDRYQVTLVKGRCFITVNNFTGSEKVLPATVSLVQKVLTTIAEETPVRLLESLPKDSLEAGSEKIIRGQFSLQPFFTFGQGDILQLGGKVFGVLGSYRSRNDSVFTRMVIPYPSRASAQAAYEHLLGHLDPYLEILSRSGSGFTFKDYAGKYGEARLKDSVLSIRVNLWEKPLPTADKK